MTNRLTKYPAEHFMKSVGIRMLAIRSFQSAQRNLTPLRLMIQIKINFVVQLAWIAEGLDFLAWNIEAGQVIPHISKLQCSAGGDFKCSGIGRCSRKADRIVIYGRII